MEELVEKPDQEYVIRYRTMPRWTVPGLWASCALLALVVVFWSQPLFLLIFKGLHLSYMAAVIMEVSLRALAVVGLAFVAYLAHELTRDDQLLLTKSGMSFPLGLAPDLLFRRERSWDDIGNILLGAMLLEDRKGTYEYELEEAKDKKKLFIYFRSGGHVTLDLSKMPKPSIEKLFHSIEAWCIACARSPQITEKSEKKKNKKFEALSYTKMWEEELHAHFSTTNFVPLEKEDCLQGGKYSVLMQLASGGLSAVYLAECDDKDLVVIKEAALPANLEADSRQKAKEMFDREARILRQLNHPNIARVLDNFLEHGRDYLVLEFVAGESLRQIVRKKGTQSEQTVLNYAAKIAQILDYLHDQEPQIVHRDITPENVVLREDGELILIDFGAANQLLGTATGTLVGKQAYIAPEQFRGKATVQSDIYALGGTLYFLLTGLDPEALSVSHPKEKRADISDEIDQLIADCTRVNAAERIADADQLIDRIAKMLPATVLTVSAGNKGTE